MNKEDLTKWATDVFWSAYKGLVKTPFPTRYDGGARGEAIKKIITLNPSADLRGRIIDSIAAQMTHRRAFYNKCGSMQKYNSETNRIKFYCNRVGSTWINNRGWDDEIPSLIDEAKEQIACLDKCSNPDCNNNAIGGNISVCQSCECKTHDVYREPKREYLRRVGLVMEKGETLHDYAMRCKEHTIGIKLSLKLDKQQGIV